jgi:hypothetical protein
LGDWCIFDLFDVKEVIAESIATGMLLPLSVIIEQRNVFEGGDIGQKEVF